MNKKLVTLVASLAILTTNVPVFASTNLGLKASEETSITNGTKVTNPKTVNEFLNSDVGKQFHATIVKEVPNNVKVMEFNNYGEAYNFMKSVKQEYDSKFIKASPNKSAMFQTAIGEGVDYYQVAYTNLPSSGTGTVSGTVKWNVPGASAQVVTSGHYFNYSNAQVTDSSRGSYISGVGIANWQEYYSGMTHPTSNAWNSTIRGKCGYFISVGGQTVGMSNLVELTCICK
ncbi:hypothetical protein P8V03_06025 [Clostridium sp. A1-XYC3]|uniref:Uncharacterized protein n=1 Tax=Clostridium tanneri TaxID=3037988 RepID=A0ABU4JRE2_9CLOT|nr:hypothetical protein [Clostridium sp. A1-XYC3]MDW8800709.1 hypothetical protein [Clostridium sp. A1-XYC3]